MDLSRSRKEWQPWPHLFQRGENIESLVSKKKPPNREVIEHLRVEQLADEGKKKHHHVHEVQTGAKSPGVYRAA